MSIKNVYSYIKEINYLIGKNFKFLPTLIFKFLFLSSLELVGIGLIAPYTMLAMNPEHPNAQKIRFFFDSLGLVSTNNQVLIYIGCSLILLFIIKICFVLYINRSILSFSYTIARHTRERLMNSYQGMAYEQYTNRNSSEYIYSLLTLSAVFAESTLQNLLRTISDFFVALFLLSFLLIQYTKEVLFFSSLLASVFIGFHFVFRKRLVENGEIVDQNSKKLVSAIHESIEGLKDIRILGKESYFFSRVLSTSTRITAARTSAIIIQTMPRYFIEFILVLFIVLLVYFAILTNLPASDLVTILGVFGVAAMRLAPSFNSIINGLSVLIQNRHSVGLLYKDIRTLENLVSSPVHNKSNYSEPFTNMILENIHFSFKNSAHKTLSDINLEIKRGRSLGIIGESGAGKSTLIDLLLGLYKPTQGTIYFNNKALTEDRLNAWTSKVAYIPQQTFIIDDSIKRNIALGCDDTEINLLKLNEVIAKSNLKSLVDQLPDGIETSIGEKGVRLSGGQRQRIAIARALYFEREVLILDEATSALDNNTESLIVDEIRSLKNEKTLIIIAHRLSTLKHCDTIYKLHKGQIVAKGNYVDIVQTSN